MLQEHSCVVWGEFLRNWWDCAKDDILHVFHTRLQIIADIINNLGGVYKKQREVGCKI